MYNIPPLFIGGAGRSGTTLLVDLMGLHPNISPVYETDFVTTLVQLFYTNQVNLSFEEKKRQYKIFIDSWSEPLPKRPHNKRQHERYVHGPHYINFSKEFMRETTSDFLEKMGEVNKDSAVQKYLNELFQESTKRDQKRFWINKTPIYVQFPSLLLKWFPNMKFIHIIRDGRDATISAMTRPWGPKTFEEGAEWWKQNVISGLKFGQAYPNNYIQVKYEDLIMKPKNTIEFILNSSTDEEIDYSDVIKMSENINLLDPKMINKWEEHEDIDGITTFTNNAGDLLAHLGYKV